MTTILTSDWRRVDLVITTLTSGGPELGGQGGGRHPERAADRLLQSQLRPRQLGAAGTTPPRQPPADTQVTGGLITNDITRIDKN